MKRFFLTAALGVVCVSAFAQGTINFANAGAGYLARVYDTDGVTGLSGSAWSVDLYWAPGTVTDSTLLTALNEPTTFSTVPNQAGLFFGGARTIPTRPNVPMTVQVRVWDTASGDSWTIAAVTPGASLTSRIRGGRSAQVIANQQRGFLGLHYRGLVCGLFWFSDFGRRLRWQFEL